jgi:hypothetical protein
MNYNTALRTKPGKHAPQNIFTVPTFSASLEAALRDFLIHKVYIGINL